MMRQAARLAAQHAAGRKAFGSALIDQPLMRGVLGDLGLETEAANATWRALCAAADGGDAAWTRLATPVAKYWLCKRAPLVAAEAMECFGGNGYDEKFPMARLYRQAPLNGLWEGSGNVIASVEIESLVASWATTWIVRGLRWLLRARRTIRVVASMRPGPRR